MTEHDETGRGDRNETTTIYEADLAETDSPLSERVIGAMSETTGSDPIALDPLGEVLDTDALDALFGPKFDGTRRTRGSVTLEYCGRRVTTQPDGTVVIDKVPEN